jgi:hypothetical protein
LLLKHPFNLLLAIPRLHRGRAFSEKAKFGYTQLRKWTCRVRLAPRASGHVEDSCEKMEGVTHESP